MRPIKLTMQAFGPYKGEEVIDFQRLGQRNLFLITGTTGAGKTSIFDAIAYALYGEASSSDRDFKNLISDFADEQTLTQVIFDFSLNNKSYRIQRIPAQEKKKQRGEGYTTQTASAELYSLSDPERPTLIGSRKVNEVNEKIMALIGLDANQFKQIMMLPQNAFRELLTSKSDERQMILQKLFMTEKYQLFEELLKDKTKGLKQSLEDVEKDLSHEINEIKITPDERLAYPIQTDLSDVPAILDSLSHLIENHAQRHQALEQDVTKGEQRLEKLNKSLHDQQTLKDTFDKQDALKAAVEGMKDKKTQMAAVETQLKDAERALFVKKEEILLNNLEEESQSLENHIQQALIEQKRANAEYENAEKRLEKAHQADKEALEQAKQNKQQMTSYREKVQQLEQAEKEQHLQERTLIKLKVEKEKILQQQKETKQTLDSLKQRISQYDSLYDQKDALNEKMSRIKETLHASQALGTLLSRYQAARNQYESYHEEYKQIKNQIRQKEEQLKGLTHQLEALKRQDAQNAAAKIAQTLKEGQPCPVCGSIHHPAVATSVNAIDEAELEKAEKERQTVEGHINSLNGRLDAIKEAGLKVKDEKDQIWVEINKHSPDTPSEPADSQRLAKLTAGNADKLNKAGEDEQSANEAFKQLTEKERQLKQLKVSFDNTQKQWDQISLTVQQTETAYNEAHLAFAGIASGCERLQQDLPPQYRVKGALEADIQTIEERIQTLTAAIQAAEKTYESKKILLNTLTTRLQQSQKTQQDLQQKLEKQRQAFESERRQYGFESVEAYRRSLMDEESVSAQRQALEAFNSLYTDKVARLNALTEELAGKTKPDPSELETRLIGLKREVESLKQKKFDVQNRLSENTKRLERISGLNVQKRDLERQYGLNGYLLDLTKGANPFRINFERFVQTSFLDDILSCANQKLERMTDGRYQLNRITQIENKRGTSGLDIEVFDQYTGEARHVKTLSGGEGFKASLAMALGLSEVVQSHSGGVSLETLFIDEGFGSLDSESLDNAIRTLMELQSGGRLVGIISHVAELKERIDTYLEVTSTKDGSYTTFFIP